MFSDIMKKIFEVLPFIVITFVVGCWIINCVKLTECDFKSPYKGEILHGLGVLGPAAVITVWFDDK